MNPIEQPSYDLEKARAEATEMKEMIADNKNEVTNYKDAGEKIEQREKEKNIESREKKITSIEQLMEEERKFLKRVDELEAEGLDGKKLNTPEFWEKLTEILNKTIAQEDHSSHFSGKREDQKYFIGESKIHNIMSYFDEVYIRFVSYQLELKNILPKGSLEDLRKSTYRTTYYPNDKVEAEFVKNDLTKIQNKKREEIKSQLEKIPENRKEDTKNIISKILLIPGAINTRDPYQAQKEALAYFGIEEEAIESYEEADMIAGIISHSFPKAGRLFARHPLAKTIK
jgi:hypothetical protein